MIRERKTAWRQNTEEHVHAAVVFFKFGGLNFDLAVFQRGNHRWESIWTDCLLGGWGGGRKEGPSQTWSPVKNSAGFPPPQSRGISSGPGGYCWSSRGFSSALITSEGMVAAPQIHATLSKCLAFFASWLVIERETRTAAPSNPYSHGDLCLGRTANVENGDRGPADFSSTALNPDFIDSRKCVSRLF